MDPAPLFEFHPTSDTLVPFSCCTVVAAQRSGPADPPSGQTIPVCTSVLLLCAQASPTKAAPAANRRLLRICCIAAVCDVQGAQNGCLTRGPSRFRAKVDACAADTRTDDMEKRENGADKREKEQLLSQWRAPAVALCSPLAVLCIFRSSGGGPERVWRDAAAPRATISSRSGRRGRSRIDFWPQCNFGDSG